MLVQSQIVSLLNQLLNQSARMRKGGNQAVYFCPACNHYKRKLEVNLETGQWHCWTCDIKGAHLGSLLSKVKASREDRDAMIELTGDLRIAQSRKPKVKLGEVQLPEEFHPLSKPIQSPEYRNALWYVQQRGITNADIVRYNIGYCDKGDYEFNVIIPSYDAKGKLNFFMGRRYYESEGVIPHKKPLASMDIVGFECFVNYDEPLNLCEGVFDAIAIRNNAIPLFGKFPSKQLREKMNLHKVSRVNMILDNDAYTDAVRNYTLLIKDVPGVEVCLIKLNGKDPSVLGFEKMHDLIRNARPFTDSDYARYDLYER